MIMTSFAAITTRLVPLVEQELLTVLGFTSVFIVVRVVHVVQIRFIFLFVISI